MEAPERKTHDILAQPVPDSDISNPQKLSNKTTKISQIGHDALDNLRESSSSLSDSSRTSNRWISGSPVRSDLSPEKKIGHQRSLEHFLNTTWKNLLKQYNGNLTRGEHLPFKGKIVGKANKGKNNP